MTEEKDFKTLIEERFAKLPRVVQDAILSGNPEKQLRELSQKHQLHLDQWQTLENLVMLTLLGVYHSDELEKRVKESVSISEEAARALTEDVANIIFEPIREELERQLDHPQAKEEEKTNVEKVRDAALARRQTVVPPLPPVTKGAPAPALPGTPPPPRPTIKVERAPVSPVYKPSERSSERKVVDGDPYREPPA